MRVVTIALSLTIATLASLSATTTLARSDLMPDPALAGKFPTWKLPDLKDLSDRARAPAVKDGDHAFRASQRLCPRPGCHPRPRLVGQVLSPD